MEASAIINNALTAVRNARQRRTADDIVETTRRLFRRQRRDGETRGRKGKEWKFLVFLLSKANDDFVPSPAENNRLQRCGFGYPTAQLGVDDRYPTKTSVATDMTVNDFEELLVNFYPQASLGMAGFVFARSDKARKLQRLEDIITSVIDVKGQVGQGKLFLIPKRDLRTLAQSVLDDELSSSPPAETSQPVHMTTTSTSSSSTAPLSTVASTSSTAPRTTVASTSSTAPLSTVASTSSTAPRSTVASTSSTAPRTTVASTSSTAPLSTVASTSSTAPRSTDASTSSTAPRSTDASTSSTAPRSTVASTSSTAPRSTDASTSSTAPLSTVASTSSTAPRSTVASTSSTVPRTTVASTSSRAPLLANEHQILTDVAGSDTSFTDTDTPTISFRRSAALTARRRIHDVAMEILSPESPSLSDQISLQGLSAPPSPFSPQGPSAPPSPFSPQEPNAPPSPFSPQGPSAPPSPFSPQGPSAPPSPFSPQGPSAPTQDQQSVSQVLLDTALSELHGLLSGSEPVTVRRDHVVEDMMELYKDSNLLQHMLNVSFEGEEGQDAGGLTKDVLTAFWESAYTRYFSGEDALVPFMPPHRYCEGSSVFPILGRILSHGIALTGFLPVRISRTVLLCVAYGPMMMDEKILLDDFLSFISEHERKLTHKGLDSFDTMSQGETSQLIDMFARFNMAVVPTRNTFKQHVLNLAVCELTGRPSFLCNQMRSGIPDLYQDVFFRQIAKEGLVSLCERLQPTPSRVADLLRTDHELRPEEDRIFYFLKDFVYSLSSQEDLIRFLQFVTASSVMPSLGITVTFHHADGLQRHPIGRTCGNVLDLPLEYNTLQEFKREFLTILRNDDSFRMFMT